MLHPSLRMFFLFRQDDGKDSEKEKHEELEKNEEKKGRKSDEDL